MPTYEPQQLMPEANGNCSVLRTNHKNQQWLDQNQKGSFSVKHAKEF